MTTFFPSICDEIPCATIYSTWECISSWSSPRSCAARITAFAMECGKCSSRQAAVLSSSFSSHSQKGTTIFRVGRAFVSVPVLSNTMVSASAMASRYLPPFTVIRWVPASRMADKTAIGMASLSAQEKSTINTANAFVVFPVTSQVSPVPARV